MTVADTYPAFGLGGVHLQPVEAVAAALEGRGVLVIAEPDVAARVAAAAGGVSEPWDNGSPIPAEPRPAAADCLCWLERHWLRSSRWRDRVLRRAGTHVPHFHPHLHPRLSGHTARVAGMRGVHGARRGPRRRSAT